MSIKKHKIIYSLFLIVSLFTMIVPSASVSAKSTTLKASTLTNGFTKRYVTPTEIIEIYANDNNISFEEAKKDFPKHFLYTTRSNTHFTLYERTLNTTNLWHRPILRIIVEEDFNNNFVRVIHASINTHGYAFQGEIFLNLENEKTLYWLVNGHFHHSIPKKSNGSISLNINQHVSISFEAEDNRYTHSYVYFDGHLRLE